MTLPDPAITTRTDAALFELIEQRSHGPYLEMFARSPPRGLDAVGEPGAGSTGRGARAMSYRAGDQWDSLFGRLVPSPLPTAPTHCRGRGCSTVVLEPLRRTGGYCKRCVRACMLRRMRAHGGARQGRVDEWMRSKESRRKR